jgi:hypothetical protein
MARRIAFSPVRRKSDLEANESKSWQMIRLRALSEKMPGPQFAAVNATPRAKDSADTVG